MDSRLRGGGIEVTPQDMFDALVPVLRAGLALAIVLSFVAGLGTVRLLGGR